MQLTYPYRVVDAYAALREAAMDPSAKFKKD